MKTQTPSRRLPAILAAMLAVVLPGGTASASVPIQQQPLFIGSGVPGNLLLVPSVEWPTIVTQANIGTFTRNRTYAGYFDSLKCYGYQHSATESERHFFPVAAVTLTGSCAGNANGRWHGNYLNWAATQTIDPFRKALTGGYRVRDTPTETWLEKARHDRDAQYPHNTITDTALTAAVTPFNTGLTTCVRNLGNRMRISAAANCNGVSTEPYNPAVHTALRDANANPLNFDLAVRVKVCDASVGVESNCVQYAQGWKPEGLLQEYNEDIRFGIFGYLNDQAMLRDGGALRARMKFVGPESLLPGRDPAVNPLREWDATTGVLVNNPDPTDAANTTAAVGQAINYSGVINYVNRFGQMTTASHKGFDPVSELYYAALRYLRNAGNIPAYTNLAGTAAQRYVLADGFPVITDWEDPMVVADTDGSRLPLYCARNAILGIGDVYTHRDKNLPGNTSMGEEPARPAEVANDDWVNVVTATQKVAELENIALNVPYNNLGTRNNSAYIAGLAYHAHTVDMRPDASGMQTVSTYWVDVRENQTLAARQNNQYWLATKYGGFTVPDGYDPYARTAPLPLAWWNSTNELLATAYPRPDNFYVASDAEAMVANLRRAFANISAEVGGSGASFAANTTRLEVGARAYQAQFFSGSWYGDLKAFDINPVTGATSDFPVWSASTRLTTLTAGTAWQSRKIYVNNGSAATGAVPPLFTHTNLSTAQRAVLSAAQVDYLRGDRSLEGTTLRPRRGMLGDIVHSEPVYVGIPNGNLYRNATFNGASTYGTFVADRAARTPVLYAGANDGMLHAFNATTGDELWAFVPRTAINTTLRDFTLPDYEHGYTVDGEMTVADVYYSGAWRTVLVGTMGRGTPGVFALDVTDPANPKFLWEVNASTSGMGALGNNLGKPIIAQVANGTWRVLMGNGPNGSGNTAQLLSINVATGAATVVNTGEGGSLGLTAIQAWDADQDGFTDSAYAGDFEGNVWRFSNLGGTPSVMRLFTAVNEDGDNQPITAAPLVARNPLDATTWVFVGTGRYLGEGDLSDDDVNSWYGLKDTGTVIADRSQLVERDILGEGTVGGRLARVIEEGNPDDFLTSRGWYIDLVSPVRGEEGERMVVPNRFQGLALIGTTRIPDSSDICNPSGRGFTMAIDPFTGGRLGNNFFDLTGDGLVDTSDGLVVDGVLTPVSGVGFNSSPNNPIFVGTSMLVTFDDGTTESLITNSGGLGVRRASWREMIVP